MEENNKTFNLGDMISNATIFLKFYLSSLKMIILTIVITLSLSLLFYVVQKPTYEANITFVLTESGGSKGGGLASLTSQFGIDLGGLGGGQASIFSGDNIYDIFKTKLVVEKVLLSQYNEGSNKKLIDVYLDFSNKKRFLKFIESIPITSYENYTLDSSPDRLKDSIMDLVYNQIVNSNINIDKLNKKGSIIKLSVVSKEEQFSKLFTERLLDEVKKLYFKIKTSNTQDNINKLQYKADSLELILSEKSIQTANSQIINVNPALRKGAVPGELNQKNLTIAMTIYGEVIKNLELSKMTQAQQTPIFQIIDIDKYPLSNSKIKIKNIILIGILLGFIISLIISFIKFITK
jgi:hypothetical protein